MNKSSVLFLRKRRCWLAVSMLMGLSFSLHAHSIEILPPDLPAAAVAKRVLIELPQVQAAMSQRMAEEAQRDRLISGPHEWNLNLGTQSKRSAPAGQGVERYTEWNAGVERTFRLPGKARTDAALGDIGVQQAQMAYGDALHEAARGLLKSWFSWQRETRTVVQWGRQVELLKQQDAAVKRRMTLGDTARIDSAQAQAALAQAEAQFHLAQLRERNAVEDLRVSFPGLPLVMPVSHVEPRVLEGERREWIEAMTTNSHELLLAKATTRRAQLEAERQEQERSADPTVGLQISREQGGEDQIVGVTLSIPLTGDTRRAISRVAHAEAEASARRETAMTRKVTAEAHVQYQSAQSGYAIWQSTRSATQRLEEAATMLDRAYRLGEGNLSDLLNARRLAHEARLTEELSRLDAQEQYYRLLLDAHRLWDFEDDAEAESAPAPLPEQRSSLVGHNNGTL